MTAGIRHAESVSHFPGESSAHDATAFMGVGRLLRGVQISAINDWLGAQFLAPTNHARAWCIGRRMEWAIITSLRLLQTTMLPSALLLLTWTAVAAAQTQRIAEGPVDTKVKTGETAILKCRVEAQKGAVQWVKGGFGLGYNRELPAAPRYTMEGSSALGEPFRLLFDATEYFNCSRRVPSENSRCHAGGRRRVPVSGWCDDHRSGSQIGKGQADRAR